MGGRILEGFTTEEGKIMAHNAPKAAKTAIILHTLGLSWGIGLKIQVVGFQVQCVGIWASGVVGSRRPVYLFQGQSDHSCKPP